MSLLRALSGRGARSRLVFIVIIAIWPLIFGGGFSLSVMTTAALYAMIAMSLGLLLGQAGQISLGQAAFCGYRSLHRGDTHHELRSSSMGRRDCRDRRGDRRRLDHRPADPQTQRLFPRPGHTGAG